MDPAPDPAPDPTTDPTTFFIDFKDAKKYFFSITFPEAHHLQTKKLNFFCQNFVFKILFCRHYFSFLNTFMRKGKDPEPDPYL
jgi:hypothetical protein